MGDGESESRAKCPALKHASVTASPTIQSRERKQADLFRHPLPYGRGSECTHGKCAP
jgi:hypothetical protein